MKLLTGSFLLRRSLAAATVVVRCSSAESAKEAGSLRNASRSRCQKASASSGVRRRSSIVAIRKRLSISQTFFTAEDDKDAKEGKILSPNYIANFSPVAVKFLAEHRVL